MAEQNKFSVTENANEHMVVFRQALEKHEDNCIDAVESLIFLSRAAGDLGLANLGKKLKGIAELIGLSSDEMIKAWRFSMREEYRQNLLDSAKNINDLVDRWNDEKRKGEQL